MFNKQKFLESKLRLTNIRADGWQERALTAEAELSMLRQVLTGSNTYLVYTTKDGKDLLTNNYKEPKYILVRTHMARGWNIPVTLTLE